MAPEVDRKSDLDRFLKGKAAIKKALIALPYPEKIRRVIAMQKLERSLKRDRKVKVYVWRID
jgi:hypothetical protein